MLFLLHLGLEGITEVDTDPKKGGWCALRLLSLMIEFSVCALSVYSTREQLAMGHFFEGLENYIQNKNEGEK